MLFDSGVGFNQALYMLSAKRACIGISAGTYPGVVELGLNPHVVTFLLILGAEHLKFRWL